MNNAQVDPADIVGVVIQQPGHLLAETRLDRNLLIEFPFHPGQVGLLGTVPIQRRDVTTHSDRLFRVQARFALLCPASVMKDRILAAKDAVRDELFVTGILLSIRSGKVQRVCRIQQRFQIPLDIGVEALENPDLMKQQRGDDQYMFDRSCRFRRGLSCRQSHGQTIAS